MKKMIPWIGAAALLVLAAVAAPADEPKPKSAAKAALARYQDAVITVKMVLKTRGGIGKSESQVEVSGTVLSPAGLTLVSDFSSNPMGLLGDAGDKVETTDVKLLLKNGREVPARFVLRDKDLDLAFVMPQEKGLDLTHVSLAKGSIPEPLDDLVFLYRMGKVMNREAGVVLGRVEAVVKKPRIFVVPDLLTGLQSLGCPVFDATGRPVGVVVIRRSPAALKDLGGVRDVMEVLKPVVLTAEDIQQAASQVEKPKDEPK
jgi:hypothetical protein